MAVFERENGDDLRRLRAPLTCATRRQRAEGRTRQPADGSATCACGCERTSRMIADAIPAVAARCSGHSRSRKRKAAARIRSCRGPFVFRDSRNDQPHCQQPARQKSRGAEKSAEVHRSNTARYAAIQTRNRISRVARIAPHFAPREDSPWPAAARSPPWPETKADEGAPQPEEKQVEMAALPSSGVPGGRQSEQSGARSAQR